MLAIAKSSIRYHVLLLSLIGYSEVTFSQMPAELSLAPAIVSEAGGHRAAAVLGETADAQGEAVLHDEIPADWCRSDPRIRRAAPLFWPRLWSSYVVPYTVKNVALRELFQSAVEQVENNTSLRFVERTNQAAYIEVVSADQGCGRSAVGHMGGRQQLVIGKQCENIVTVLHELMHALGLEHEHQRADRDQYVVIASNDLDLNTQLISNRVVPGLPYDYESVTHYPFLKARNKDKQTLIGPKDHLSNGDILALNWLYPDNSVELQPIRAIPSKLPMRKGEGEYEVTLFVGGRQSFILTALPSSSAELLSGHFSERFKGALRLVLSPAARIMNGSSEQHSLQFELRYGPNVSPLSSEPFVERFNLPIELLPVATLTK